MKKIAIVCVTYNRLNSLKRLLSSLERMYFDDIPQSLIISVDKSNTSEVEDFAKSYNWRFGDYKCITHETNLGLRKHILSIGTLLDSEYDAVIVLEDDITVSPNMIRYARACVDKYYDDELIAGISLYRPVVNTNCMLPFDPVKSEYDVFLSNRAISWGQIWMKKQWTSFMAWYNKNNDDFNLEYLPQNINRWNKKSWLKYHVRYCIENNKYFVYPYFGMSTNNNEAGVHASSSDTLYQSILLGLPCSSFNLPDSSLIEVRYDGFMEPKFLLTYLGIKDEELCVDILGSKPSCLYKKYLLTTKSLPYKVIKRFDLALRPVELNIIFDRCSKDGRLFLYDTSEKGTNPNIKNNDLTRYQYYFGCSFYQIHKMLSTTRIAKFLVKSILGK